MFRSITNFAADKSGVTAIEYALIASLIAVFIIVAVQKVERPGQHCVQRCEHQAQVRLAGLRASRPRLVDAKHRPFDSSNPRGRSRAGLPTDFPSSQSGRINKWLQLSSIFRPSPSFRPSWRFQRPWIY